jgi:prepilin-type N-terminal cleavage/methylation domain-containing protein
MKEVYLMKKTEAGEKGFTLIEVIVTLVLVGITAALAGMWIVSVANGYVFAKMNANTVQKGQLAITRLEKEFAAIQSVNPASGSGITYIRTDNSLGTVTCSVRQSGAELQLQQGTGAPWYPLTDNVSSGGLSLRYCDDIPPNTGTQVCGTTWSSTRRIVEITLTLTGANSTPSTFVQRVTPRNL